MDISQVGVGGPPRFCPEQEWQAAELLSQRFLSDRIRDAILPKPIPRRMKRMVADCMKDNKYWEKRKRNNDAARKSRENRRKVEVEARTRLIIMEEENSLLKKEISILKTKYSLPQEQRFLSIDDKGELVPCKADLFLPPEPIPQDAYMEPAAGRDALSSSSGSIGNGGKDEDDTSGSGSGYACADRHSSGTESSEESGNRRADTSPRHSLSSNDSSVPHKKRRLRLAISDVDDDVTKKSESRSTDDSPPCQQHLYDNDDRIARAYYRQHDVMSRDNFEVRMREGFRESMEGEESQCRYNDVSMAAPIGVAAQPIIRRLYQQQPRDLLQEQNPDFEQAGAHVPTLSLDNVAHRISPATAHETQDLRNQLRMLTDELSKVKEFVLNKKKQEG